ncbi:MAG: hypothetical protein IT215_05255, partial [Chitinophagaceae bacterium]|nr:hypothetical protein [Chitinophagaceae bacterium]
SNTSLLNKDDKKQGDYLPTFKPGVGVSAGYHFTLFKAIPLGISAIASYNQSGQNYNGKYEDSSSFYAYSRLNYFRIGASLQFGTNIRRQVSLAATIGANYGFLTNYKERYELIEYNNDRYILDINDLNVSMRDTVLVVGELAEPIYNKTDLNIFGTLGLDFLLNENLVFGFGGRMDMGINSVESNAKNSISIQNDPPIVNPFDIYNLQIKYRESATSTGKRATTINQAYGIYFSLKYRIFNKEKTEFWYKERRWDNVN